MLSKTQQTLLALFAVVPDVLPVFVEAAAVACGVVVAVEVVPEE